MVSTPAGRAIGGLTLSCVQVDNPMLVMRAAHWHNALAKVGLAVPFWAVHDVGVLATADGGSAVIQHRQALHASRPPPQVQAAMEVWLDAVREIAQAEMMEKSRGWRLSDELISVLLLKILGPIYERHLGPGRRPTAVPLPLDPELYRDVDPQLFQLFSAHDRSADTAFLSHLAEEHLRLIISVEQIDLDTLRLLGMFGAEASAASALGMLDLLNVFASPEANDVVNFSLDLIPSVLETKRASGQQTFSVDGYAGLARRGTLDSLMLSELAFDEDLFDQRF
ncbi:MAG TPA: hypothetical protein ENK57_16485, partial [Polyangiaceae bacterium]|nr:hypothetical protein [Polyangiaceae bacterium]